MKQHLEILNLTLDKFIETIPVPERYNLRHHFDVCSECATDIIRNNPSLRAKDVFELLTLKQDGSYPPVPKVDAARMSVHLLWHISKNPKFLYKLIKNKTSPWYVKAEALKCLRLVPKTAVKWTNIITVIKNFDLDNEVKRAALDTIVFHGHDELLPDLEVIKQQTSNSDYFGSRLHMHILFAMAELGDLKTTIPLLEYCNDSNFITQQDANKVLLKLLEKNGGAKRVASEILDQSNIKPNDKNDIWLNLQAHENQAVIIWALSQAPTSKAQIQNCIDLLSHREWKVKKSASNWLSKNKVNKELLLGHIADTNHEQASRSWAAYSLLEIDPSFERHLKPYLHERDVFYKEWPFEAPENVRTAIVCEYATYCGSGTDIRYMLEAKLKSTSEQPAPVSPPFSTPLEARLALVDVLKNNGIRVSKQQSISEFMGQGGGNYWVLTLEKIDKQNITTLCVTDLGGFVARDIGWFESENSYNKIDEVLSAQSKNRIKLCEKIITENGFMWLNEDVLQNTVPDLNFGRTKNNTVANFLFDWDS